MTPRGAAVLFVLFAGCSEPTEHPPATCVGCVGPPTGGGVGVGTGGSSGTGGGQGEGGEGAQAGTGVTLEGDVLVINDVDFESATGAMDPVALQAQGADGSTVVGTFNGNDPFHLEGVRRSSETWLLATPSASEVALPTLGPLDTSKPDSNGKVGSDVVVVATPVIDTILNLLTTPVTRDPDQAILVLRATDEHGMPLAGVSVTVRSAQTIAYAVSGTYSDDVSVTDRTGLVVVVNVPASAWAGSLVPVTFTGALQGGAEVRAVRGAVTFELIR